MNVSKKKVTSSLTADPHTEVVIDSKGVIRYPANGLDFEYQELTKLLLSTVSLSLEEKVDLLRSLHRMPNTQIEKLEKVLKNEFEKLKKADTKNPGYLKDIRQENIAGLDSTYGITVRFRDFEK